MRWIKLAQDKVMWLVLLNMVMNLMVPKNGNFFVRFHVLTAASMKVCSAV
jgi:hypothetical protein